VHGTTEERDMNTAATLLAWDGHGGPGPWILFFPLVWAIAVVAVIAVLRRTVWRGRAPWRGTTAPAGPAPVDILSRRFAEGQIDEDEYWLRLSVLNESRRGKDQGGAA
jgi:putative membrane protein